MRYLIYFLILVLSESVYAHKEWVHQYIVGEGYKFVENEYNLGKIPKINISDLNDLQEKILYSDGTLFTGHASEDGTWEEIDGKYVSLGAWMEDVR